MEEVYEREVRPLLDLVDQLRDLGINEEENIDEEINAKDRAIPIPQIVVMGDQSSGKSSVLQSICGIPFPRGSGLVTRCPTELILSKAGKIDLSHKSADAGENEISKDLETSGDWIAHISLSNKSKRENRDYVHHTGFVHDPTELCDRIEKLTNVLTKDEKNGFSSESIVIKITSSTSPDLTIIDLPGIVRTSTLGQSPEVIHQVNTLIDKYIAMPNTIILAVVPCNQDIATVDILERALKVDVEGQRTIAVLTKPDLINPGAENEVLEILENKTKPLRLGYTMVKNLTQKQLTEGELSITAQREDEENFFRSHPVFSKLLTQSSDKLLGVNILKERLTNVLVSNIKSSLPTIISDVTAQRQAALEELEHMKQELPTDPSERQSLLAKKIGHYCGVLRNSSKGEYRDTQSSNILLNNQQLRLQAQIQNSYKKLQESIAKLRPVSGVNLGSSVDIFSRLEEEMDNQRGRELPGFLNTQVFYAYIVELVEEWRPIIEECKSEIVNSTLSISSMICAKVVEDFPELNLAIREITNDLIATNSTIIGARLDELVQREQDPFTTQDVLLEVVNGIRFRNFENVLRQILDTIDPKEYDSVENIRQHVEKRLGGWYMMRHGVDVSGNKQEMVTLIQAYWDIASRRLTDNVCMCIEMEFRDKFVKELETQCVLFGFSLDDARISNLLTEDVSLSKRRLYLTERIDMLTQAQMKLKLHK